MLALGWSGRYGLYEAVDYSSGSARQVRSWMAHHQGMILLSVCNVLHRHAMQSYFHAEPQVAATELLLHERVPRRTTDRLDEQATRSLSLLEEGAA